MAKRDLSLKELGSILHDFDKEYWVAPKDLEGKTRHLALHLTKLIGKIGEIAERREHGIEPELSKLKKEVVPDLVIYALSLADLYKVDLNAAFLKRLEDNKKRVRSWKKQK